jgi:hypothetical protein
MFLNLEHLRFFCLFYNTHSQITEKSATICIPTQFMDITTTLRILNESLQSKRYFPLPYSYPNGWLSLYLQLAKMQKRVLF